MSVLESISEALQAGQAREVKQLVQQAIDEGIGARAILADGLLAGMTVIGAKFKANEVYVPEVLIAARAMNIGVALLKPLLVEQGVKATGKVVIGTVKGDLHDIGKNVVRTMMEGRGLEVIDLGADVSASRFVEAAREHGADIVALSALLTTTMIEMKTVIEALEAAGLRDKVKVMIGGAPVTEAYRVSIGADAYSADGAAASEAAAAFVQRPAA